MKWIRKNALFLLASTLSVGVASWGLLSPDGLGTAAAGLTSRIFGAVDWFFLLAVTLFVVASLYLALGRYGKIRLGQDHERPEFSTVSWLAMLFAAGMGVGLLFWGVAEPIIHFSSPPDAPGLTPDAARRAMVITNFHWGIHAWAVYCVAALVIAYFGFRKGTPCMPGAPLRHVFRGKWVGPVSFLADLVGLLAVSLGVSGSIGMGILQIQSGLHEVADVSAQSVLVAAGILLVLVVAYLASASTGLDKGIKWLSNLNMGVAILLLLFVLLAGPTATLLAGSVTSLGDYASSLVGLSLRMFPYRDLQEWTHSWTLTYFIFWIAWAPFVGVFVARISRGRTIREFVLSVLFVPTLFSILWFAVFGGCAIHEEVHGAGGIVELVNEDVTVALFSLFERFPFSEVLAGTSVLLVFIFLVTSADSATFVLGMLSTRGSLNPPMVHKLVWGGLIGLLSGALMLTRNIDPLRAVVVMGAIPFVFILLLQLAALLQALSSEPKAPRSGPAIEKVETPDHGDTSGSTTTREMTP